MIQKYQNDSKDTPLETVFYFPIDTDFSLTKIKVDFVNMDKPDEVQTIETVIEERK